MKQFFHSSKGLLFFGVILSIFLVSNPVWSEDLNASLAFLPKVSESPTEGVFVDLVKAIDEAYTDGNITIKVYPFNRSLDNVITGKADFHIPFMKNPFVPEEKLPFRYGSVKMGKVVFVIYSHKDKPITMADIKKAKSAGTFSYKIEGYKGLEDFYIFPVIGSSGIDQSMQKVVRKRIDACIFAQEEADFVLKTLKLKDLRRDFYYEFDDVFLVSKGEKGEKADQAISGALTKLKAENRLKELHSKIHLPYNKWQPSEMGW